VQHQYTSVGETMKYSTQKNDLELYQIILLTIESEIHLKGGE